jgi:DNA modification methylase
LENFLSSEQQIFDFEPIKGFPYIHWKGKQPYKSTQYFPAQCKECIGEEQDGWINRLYWGDNLQVMSHLMKEFRGKIDLIYIDPPFDSKADYKIKIELRGKKVESDFSTFEDKQYEDIWSNDEYLQFMYERLVLVKELLSSTGSIFLHCDWHKSAHLRLLLEEVFGEDNLINEIIWGYKDVGGGKNNNFYKRKHDTIFWFSKNKTYKTSEIARAPLSESTLNRFSSLFDANGNITYRQFMEKRPAEFTTRKKQGRVPDNIDEIFLSKDYGRQMEDYWIDINPLRNRAEKDNPDELFEYPTQKPEPLLERIIKTVTVYNDIVFDCFMGSGTTQAVAMKLGRRFIGADINLGAIQTTMKRLSNLKKEIDASLETEGKKYTGFKIFNVNNYDFFNNPVQAKELLIEALGIQKHDSNSCYDGVKDGRMVKIMPINRIASKADISTFAANLPYSKFEERKDKNPHEPVEKFLLICMGHEPVLKAELEKQLANYKIDVEIRDILRDEAVLELKREAEADIQRDGNKLFIKKFYPMNLMQKLNFEHTMVSDWKELVDSVLIDFNYDQVEAQWQVFDIPDKNRFVKGEYDIPKDAGRIKVKITDLISESYETELE